MTCDDVQEELDALYYQKGDKVKGGNDANGGAEGGTGREWVHYCLISVHLEIISVNLEIISVNLEIISVNLEIIRNLENDHLISVHLELYNSK